MSSVRLIALACTLSLASIVRVGYGEVPQRVVDVPTRPGVTQRFVLLTPTQPKAVVVLFAGGHGGLQIQDNGSFRWGTGNFLVRSRQSFAERTTGSSVRPSTASPGGFSPTRVWEM